MALAMTDEVETDMMRPFVLPGTAGVHHLINLKWTYLVMKNASPAEPLSKARERSASVIPGVEDGKVVHALHEGLYFSISGDVPEYLQSMAP